MNHSERLAALRLHLLEQGITAYFLPNSDPHQSEYLAEHWRLMPWLTGFSGSAGNVVVTAEMAGVWTDSRYFIQAEQELAGTGFTLQKLKIPHTPEYLEWLAEHLPKGSSIGLDGSLVSLANIRSLKKRLADKNIHIQDVGDWMSQWWPKRPALPVGEAMNHSVSFAGKTTEEKLSDLRQALTESNATHQLLTSLDDIAWLMNLRGADITYNPVVLAYALVDQSQATLFIQAEKVPTEVAETLKANGVSFAPYAAIDQQLADLSAGSVLHYEASKISWQLSQQIPAHTKRMEGMQLTTPLKARKNETEQGHIRAVMVKDGLALVHFLRWLEQEVGQRELNEYEVGERLTAFRAEQGDFFGPSFGSIVGYQGNGAIVHYSAKAETAAKLQAEGILLVDSGGQYLNGTTDITRTLALGEPTAEQQRDFTLVLKGHIALARAVFPAGTAGYQLEILARQALWQHGLNYGHGTGHGVGFFLNVHEGPQSISSAAGGRGATPLEVGMFTSNEPGVYHTDRYGIRIENLILCVPHSTSEAYGEFLAFETVSLCPIDRKLIDTALLNEGEKNWLNAYHQQVLDKLNPHLEAEAQQWLAEQCLAI